jgi:membrane-bound lytic murein transglycosylase
MTMDKTGTLYISLAFWMVQSGKEAAFTRSMEGIAQWTKIHQTGSGTAKLLQDADNRTIHYLRTIGQS